MTIDRWLASLRAAGISAADGLAPGVDDAMLDAVTRPLGIELPEEARRWWRRFNGYSDRVPVDRRTLGVGWEALSIEQAAEEYHQRMRLAEELAGNSGGDFPATEMWEPSWWPVFASSYNSTMAIDTAVVRDGCSPVRNVDWQLEFRPVRAQSLDEVLRVWTDAIEEATASGGAADGRLDFGELPDRFWETRLV